MYLRHSFCPLIILSQSAIAFSIFVITLLIIFLCIFVTKCKFFSILFSLTDIDCLSLIVTKYSLGNSMPTYEQSYKFMFLSLWFKAWCWLWQLVTASRKVASYGVNTALYTPSMLMQVKSIVRNVSSVQLNCNVAHSVNTCFTAVNSVKGLTDLSTNSSVRALRKLVFFLLQQYVSSSE